MLLGLYTCVLCTSAEPLPVVISVASLIFGHDIDQSEVLGLNMRVLCCRPPRRLLNASSYSRPLGRGSVWANHSHSYDRGILQLMSESPPTRRLLGRLGGHGVQGVNPFRCHFSQESRSCAYKVQHGTVGDPAVIFSASLMSLPLLPNFNQRTKAISQSRCLSEQPSR